MTNQEKIDALAAQVAAFSGQLVTVEANIRQDIADLKAANPAADFSALEANVANLGAAVAALQGLDAENPAPPAP